MTINKNTTPIESHTSQTSTQSMSGLMQKLRQYALPVMIALTPAAFNTACDSDDPKPIEKPVGIDHTTDNAAHKADFMKDVKPAVLGNGVATIDFSARWIGGKYYLELKEIIFDFDKGVENLKKYIQNDNIAGLKLVFNFTDNKDIRVNWVLPAELLINGGLHNIMDARFDQYMIKTDLSVGNKNTAFPKGASGYLAVRVFNEAGLLGDVMVVSPYDIGK